MREGKSFIVYQAYGMEEVMHEVLISIASLFKITTSAHHPIVVVVYTNAKEKLAPYLPENVEFREIALEQWQKWKGEKNFVHRAKIEMLIDFCKFYNGNVLYCDTDTYFLSDPSPLFNYIEEGGYVMHTDEGMLDGSVNKVFQKLGRFLKNYKYKGSSFPVSTHMWNAGVLGFSSTEQEVLQEVLSFADDLYNSYPKHVMEQLAFSYYFGKKQRLACENFIYHYWDFKEYRKTLKGFFKEVNGAPFETWQNKTDNILPMELIKAKKEFLAKPYLVRKTMKLFGKGF